MAHCRNVDILFPMAAKTPLFRSEECSNPSCRFRFPLIVGQDDVAQCPKCGAPLDAEKSISYGRHQIAHTHAEQLSQMHVLLDNIRSVYNVGSIFRTAAALGVTKLHLCGMTATPEHPRLTKTAIGAEKAVPWAYANNALLVADELIARGFSLWAIEGGEGATSLFEMEIPQPNAKFSLVVGNEQTGVDPALLARCERILYIPMLGGKESLNVTVAFGIAAYYLRNL